MCSFSFLGHNYTPKSLYDSHMVLINKILVHVFVSSRRFCTIPSLRNQLSAFLCLWLFSGQSRHAN